MKKLRCTIFIRQLLFITALNSFAAYAQNAPSLETCPVLPPDNIWNTPVDTLSVDKNSDMYVDTIGRDTNAHPDFGASWEGSPIGIPYMVVDSSQTKLEVAFDYGDESDAGPYPIPENPLIDFLLC
mgnify:FL=1